VRINGQPQVLKPGDMYMADAQGILSSVIYGPDQRTQIRPDTREVLYITYAPTGVSESTLRAHMEELVANVRLVSPECTTELLAVVG
jgi:hypothetical protein